MPTAQISTKNYPFYQPACERYKIPHECETRSSREVTGKQEGADSGDTVFACFDFQALVFPIFRLGIRPSGISRSGNRFYHRDRGIWASATVVLFEQVVRQRQT